MNSPTVELKTTQDEVTSAGGDHKYHNWCTEDIGARL